MEDIRDEEVQAEASSCDNSTAECAANESNASRFDDTDGTPAKGGTTEDAPEKEPSTEDRSAEAAGAPGADEITGAGKSGQKESAAEESEKKGFFGKKKKDKRDQQIEELTDRVQRQMAEFDNFRKRSEKEKASMFEVGAKSVLEKILPTVDNFERGFAGLDEEQKQDAFVQGMEKIYRQMLTSLEGIGVKPIEAVGQPFDPNFHNAVMHVEDEEAGENVVVEEFQKGYLYRDTVLRHSMVKVAN
ncbi:MAG: nucleotide exchange factor GrpE [Lachnospiraceae bacterium]|nr:nucleotide exchange factor GrpE [Lachnospiraceae bacterium]